MMILRVYAMWNRSRTILCVLLFIYMVQTIFSVVVVGIYINPDTSLSGMSQASLIVLMQSKVYCPIFPALFSSHDFRSSRFLGRLVLQFLLERPTEPHDVFCNSPICSQRCAFDSRSHANPEGVSHDVQSNEAVAAQPVHEASREGWNHLFLHVRQPISSSCVHSISHNIFSYVLCFRIAVRKQLTRIFSPQTRNLLYNTLEATFNGNGFTTSNHWMILLVCFFYLLFATIMPWFIISVREMYEHDLRTHWRGIDSGFGVLSQPIASQNGALSAIVFADVAPGQDQVVEGAAADDSEAIQLEVVMDGVRQA